MSGGSQHNPNGRQAQLGPSWSPLQLQVASYLGRAPQAHMASERGVTWHTPTPPPHLYHVPATSPPDPLQAMKMGSTAGTNAYRHTATPPELYRHTPTPPEKHFRHTPSPGDVKSGPAMTPNELYPHLAQPRDKLVRPEDMLAYARSGVDLTLGRTSLTSANGAPLALSIRDAPTINSLIARAQPRHPHTRVDALLERLVPSPVSPQSVIVHSRVNPTPSPPSSNEDSADSCGAPPGSKRKRKPERTIRVPSAPPPPTPPEATTTSDRPPSPQNTGSNLVTVASAQPKIEEQSRLSPEIKPENEDHLLENGDTSHIKQNGPSSPEKMEVSEVPHTRRKTRSGSAETIDDIAAMIASTDKLQNTTPPEGPESKYPANVSTEDTPDTVDGLKNVLGSPEGKTDVVNSPRKSPVNVVNKVTPSDIRVVEVAAAPKRRSTRTSESTNVPVESPSEAKPAETESSTEEKHKEPIAASFVEVENQLEKMFAGIEEAPPQESDAIVKGNPNTKKRRRSVAPKSTTGKKTSRRSSGAASTSEDMPSTKKKPGRKKSAGAKATKQKKMRSKEPSSRDAYDSGSNASSSRSRGPYIQIRGPRDSPSSVNIINATTGDDDCDGSANRPRGPRNKCGNDDYRNGLRKRGLHCSTLSLRYDATNPDTSWVCVFCERGPHAGARDKPELRAQPLGDLFGPYTVSTDCEDYRTLDEQTRRSFSSEGGTIEVWFHEECGIWAPGLVASGARLWGLESAVWGARGARCCRCGAGGAGVACATRACPARAHVRCARAAHWRLSEEDFRAVCARHA